MNIEAKSLEVRLEISERALEVGTAAANLWREKNAVPKGASIRLPPNDVVALIATGYALGFAEAKTIEEKS